MRRAIDSYFVAGPPISLAASHDDTEFSRSRCRRFLPFPRAHRRPGLAASTGAPALTAPLPVDSKVKIGTLPNGIRYYIRQNPKPEKRAELRLVVNAGSVLESDNQLGLAHFVEHTAFNGTTHFAKNDLVKYLQSDRRPLWRRPGTHRPDSTRRCTSCRCRRTRRASSSRRSRFSKTGRTARCSTARRSRTNAAWCARNGGSARARAIECCISGSRPRSRDRGTPSGFRSETPKASCRRRRHGCVPSTRAGIAPTCRRSSPSGTSTPRRSKPRSSSISGAFPKRSTRRNGPSPEFRGTRNH